MGSEHRVNEKVQAVTWTSVSWAGTSRMLMLEDTAEGRADSSAMHLCRLFTFSDSILIRCLRVNVDIKWTIHENISFSVTDGYSSKDLKYNRHTGIDII